MENNAYGNSNAVLLGKIYQLNATVKRISTEKEHALEECSALKASCAGLAQMYDELKARLAEKIVQDIPASDHELTETDCQKSDCQRTDAQKTDYLKSDYPKTDCKKSDGQQSADQIVVSEPPFVFFDDNVAVRQRIASRLTMTRKQPPNRTPKTTPDQTRKRAPNGSLARCLATWRIARPPCRGDTCDPASADLPGRPPPCQSGVNKHPLSC